jgi:hypothetical protein
MKFVKSPRGHRGARGHTVGDHCCKVSRYNSEALRLWPQCCNTAKPTRCYNGLLQVQSNSLQDMQLW